jgi:maleate isomerase
MTNTLSPRMIFGMLVPWENTTAQIEFDSLRVEGSCAAVARFDFLNPQGIKDEVLTVAHNLMRSKPDAILFMLSPELQPGGLKFVRSMCMKLEAATSLQVFNASESIHAALSTIGISRISILTPSSAKENDNARKAFEESGFEVARVVSLEKHGEEIAKTPVAEIEQCFQEANDDQAEAIVQIGGGLACLGLVAKLEQVLQKPVITCNGACYWQALRATGIEDSISGFGTLLADY